MSRHSDPLIRFRVVNARPGDWRRTGNRGQVVTFCTDPSHGTDPGGLLLAVDVTRGAALLTAARHLATHGPLTDTAA